MPRDPSPSLLALLRRDPWFASLDPDLTEALVNLSVRRVLAHGQYLFFRGDPPDGLFVVIDGVLRITGVAETGEEALLSLLEPAMWFGEVSLFDRLPRAHDAIAEGAATVLQVRQRDMEALLARSPHHWHDMGALMALKARLLFLNLEDLSTMPPSVRLARRLLWMVHTTSNPHQGPSLGRLVVSQSDLAATLCIARQTANRILQVLQGQGVLRRVSPGVIDILDQELLGKAARLSSMERQVLRQPCDGPASNGETFEEEKT